MEGELLFCSDSVLRFRSTVDEKTAYPMVDIQKAISAEDDPYFLLRYFNHEVIIESGTTLSNVFFAIEPWEKLLSAYLDRDVVAYIAEIRKPHEVSNDDYETLEWIGITREAYIRRAYLYEALDKDTDIMEMFSRPRKPTDLFDVETYYSASGYLKGNNQKYSISHGLHGIKNLPVVLYKKATVSAYNGSAEELFNKDIRGVETIEDVSTISSETSFTLRELLEAIFISGLFFYAPDRSDDMLEALKEATATLAETLKEKASNPDQETVVDERDTSIETGNDNNKPKDVVILLEPLTQSRNTTKKKKTIGKQSSKKSKGTKVRQ